MGVDRKITVHDWAYVLNESEHAHDIDSTKFNGVSLRQELVRLYAVESELAALRQENTELRAMRDQQFSVLQQVRAELKTSQQRVSELQGQLEAAEKHVEIVCDARDEIHAMHVKTLTALASREAALRDVAHLLGPWTQPAEGRPRGLTAAVKLAYDRAAQEVGR